MHFDSNHIGKIAEMHKFCPTENLIGLSLQSSKGLSLKKCRENAFPSGRDENLQTETRTPYKAVHLSCSYWTSETFLIANSISFCFLNTKKTSCCFCTLTFCTFYQRGFLRFFSQSQAKPRRVTSNNIYKHDLYFQNKARDMHGLKLLSKKACTEIASSWPVMLYYVNTISWNTVCKQQRRLLTFQAMQERIQAFLPGGLLPSEAALGLVSITPWWIGIPYRGHSYLHCLLNCSTSSSLNTDGWSIWFRSNQNSDFSVLRTLPSDMFALRL